VRQPAPLPLWCELEAHRLPLMATPPLSREAMQEAVDAVARNGGSRAAAALELGLPRTTLSTRYHAARAAGVEPCSQPPCSSSEPSAGSCSAQSSPSGSLPYLSPRGGTTGTKFVVACDSHGDSCDPAAIEAFLGFVDAFRPAIRIHAGDAFDFRPLRNGASKEEAEEELMPDMEAGEAFLWRYKPQVFLKGNHDARLWEQADRKGPVSEFCRMLAGRLDLFFGSMQTKVLPYDVRHGVYELAPGLRVAHGFAAGINATSQMAKVYGNVLHGHNHTVERVTVPGLPPKTGWSAGCLCKLEMAYSSRRLTSLRQMQGFASGEIFPDGTYRVQLHEIRDGVVIE
jgi:hypothetical protein